MFKDQKVTSTFLILVNLGWIFGMFSAVFLPSCSSAPAFYETSLPAKKPLPDSRIDPLLAPPRLEPTLAVPEESELLLSEGFPILYPLSKEPPIYLLPELQSLWWEPSFSANGFLSLSSVLPPLPSYLLPVLGAEVLADSAVITATQVVSPSTTPATSAASTPRLAESPVPSASQAPPGVNRPSTGVGERTSSPAPQAPRPSISTTGQAGERGASQVAPTPAAPPSPTPAPPRPRETSSTPPGESTSPSIASTSTGVQRRIESEVGKTLRVVLPGLGWIFLGEEGGTNKVRYLGKEVQTESTIFSFTLQEEGTTILRFQQQDLPARTTLYESVQVSSTSPVASASPIFPSSPSPVPPSDKIDKPPIQPAQPAQTTQSAQPSPFTQPTQSAPGSSTLSTATSPSTARVSPEGERPNEPRAYVEQLLKEKKYPETVQVLELIIQQEEETQGQELDQWYFLLAQLYETVAEVRNIRRALFYYEKLRNTFPFSPYWDEADYRSRYIRRNFLEVR
ncbi:MAG: hypothetical protein SNJ78_03005 [Spirochaetales bacterium]